MSIIHLLALKLYIILIVAEEPKQFYTKTVLHRKQFYTENSKEKR